MEEKVMKKSHEKLLGIVFTGLVLTMALTGVTTSGAFAADTVKIGYLAPLSGPADFIGKMAVAAAQFAIDEQNAKGGIAGKKIELLTEDNEMKVDVGLRKAKKLILKDKVQFISVMADEALALALNNLVPDHKVIQLGTSAMSMELTGKEFNRYTFRFGGTMWNAVAEQGQVCQAKGFKKVYFVGLDILPAHEHLDLFKAYLKTSLPGIDVIGEDFFGWNNKDFGPYVTKIKAAEPDIIMLGAYGPDAINMIRQSRAMGLKTPFVAHSVDQPMLMALGADSDGLYYSCSYSTQIQTPENKAFLKKWHEKYGNRKEMYLWYPAPELGRLAFGWMMAIEGLAKAASLDPEKIIKTLETFEYMTPIGEVWKMRACDHNTILPGFGGSFSCASNTFYDGNNPDGIELCWESPDIMRFPTEKINGSATIPELLDYNPACE